MGATEPEYRDDLDSLRDPTMPLVREVSLQRKRQSLTATILKRAWEGAGETLEEPGAIQEYYCRDTGVVIAEFRARRDIDQVHRPSDDLLVIEFESDG
jgi:hypothetical protein